MPRDLTKAEYGMLQESMVQIIHMTGERPTVLLAHPLVLAELGVALALFGMEHNVEIKREPRLLPPSMMFEPPKNKSEAWRG